MQEAAPHTALPRCDAAVRQWKERHLAAELVLLSSVADRHGPFVVSG